MGTRQNRGTKRNRANPTDTPALGNEVGVLIERLGEAHAALLKAEVVLAHDPSSSMHPGRVPTDERMRRAALADVRKVIEDIESDEWWEETE